MLSDLTDWSGFHLYFSNWFVSIDAHTVRALSLFLCDADEQQNMYFTFKLVIFLRGVCRDSCRSIKLSALDSAFSFS